MRTRVITAIIVAFLLQGAVAFAHEGCCQGNGPVEKTWTELKGEHNVLFMTLDGVMVHESDPKKQPQPPVVTPGKTFSNAPSDAIVLFDGSEKSFKENWAATNGEPTKWVLKDGAMEPVRHSGYIQSKQKFGSCQLHIEWAAPSDVKGGGQGRGNSGVFLMANYEVQILDCYENQTYPDGQAGALYGRSKPLVNACRKPGEWQSYDIIFHQPTFKDGKVVRKATFTVLHNGVLIQDHTVLHGGTGWMGRHAASPYKEHADKLPIQMQDHGNPVKFRNVWIRELKD